MAFNWQTEYHRYQHYFSDLSHFAPTKKTKAYTGLVLSFFTIAFFLFFAIKPTIITIVGLNKEIKDKKVVIEKLDKKIQSLSDAQKIYLGIQDDLPLIDEALPKTSEIQTLIKQIEALATISNVNLDAAKYDEVVLSGTRGKTAVPPSEDTYSGPLPTNSIIYDTSVSGSYDNLKTFLAGLGQIRRINVVTAFSCQNSNKQATEEKVGSSTNLTLTLSASAYSLNLTQ